MKTKSINPTLFRKGACLGTGCLDHELLLLHPGGCSWKGMAIRQGINLSPDILVGYCALIKIPPKIASNIYTIALPEDLASISCHPSPVLAWMTALIFTNLFGLNQWSDHCVARQGLNHLNVMRKVKQQCCVFHTHTHTRLLNSTGCGLHTHMP